VEALGVVVVDVVITLEEVLDGGADLIGQGVGDGGGGKGGVESLDGLSHRSSRCVSEHIRLLMALQNGRVCKNGYATYPADMMSRVCLLITKCVYDHWR
jgi:hypothetical protein